MTKADEIHLAVSCEANTLSWLVKKIMRGQHVELASKKREIIYEKRDSRCVTIDLRCFKQLQVSG